MVALPHFLLFSEASCAPEFPSWRFVLQDVESRRRMVISDVEETTCGERLELLAVVRGLEALSGPARVTLITKSRYVSRGLRSGMTEWRANDWQWERFGRVVPVKDHDLWQRIDRALLFHQVDCQTWQFDETATPEESPVACGHAAEAEPIDESDSRFREATPAPRKVKSGRGPLERPAIPATRRGHGAASPGRPFPATVCSPHGGRKAPPSRGKSLSSTAVGKKVAKMRCTLRELVGPLWPLTTGAA